MVGQREIEERRLRRQTAEQDADRVSTLESPDSMSETLIIASGDVVLDAEAIAGGLIVRDPSGSDRTDTTDDADEIIEECGLTADEMYHDCLYFNDADAPETVTIAGGSGVTVVNPEQTVSTKRCVTMRFHRTGDATINVYLKGA